LPQEKERDCVISAGGKQVANMGLIGPVTLTPYAQVAVG